MKRRVLIIHENMGMGHRRMAGIVRGILEQKDELEVIGVAGSELLGASSGKALVFLWNFLIRKNLIRTVDLLLNFFTRIFVLPVMEVSETPKFWRKLEEINPDVIISTSDGVNKVLGTYSASKGIPFYIFIVDISVFTDLVHPDATHVVFFPETVEAIQSYDFSATYFAQKLNKATPASEKLRYVLGCWRDYGLRPFRRSLFRNTTGALPKLNDARTLVIGLLAEQKHFQPKDPAALKRKLGLDSGLDNVLIASGSIGGRYLLDAAKAICATYTKPANLLLMCGRDQAAYEKCKAFRSRNAAVKIRPFEYVSNFDEFLTVADCVVVRPSAGIFVETLLNKTPTIAWGSVPSNDKGSLTIIDKYHVGEICHAKDDLPRAIAHVLRDKARYVQNIERVLNLALPSFEQKAQIILNEFRVPGAGAHSAEEPVVLDSAEDLYALEAD